MSKLNELAAWLSNESTKLIKEASGRRSCADLMRNATPADLRSAMVLARKMHGHKLHGIGVDTRSAKASADIDDRIAAKLELEAKQLAEWAEEVRIICTAVESHHRA